MPICYFLPGILGSELLIGRPDGVPIWLNYGLIAGGGMELLRLDGSGLLPAAAGGVQILGGAPIASIYGSTLNALAVNPLMHRYTIKGWGYDWRLDLQTTGRSLAQAIIADGVSRGSPCSIVGHSMGGLVARLAWSYLVRWGLTSYCRRIVTLGTPHYGSWSAPQLLIGIEPTMRQIGQVQRTAQLQWWLPLSETVPGTWIQAYLAGLFATFPSVYQLMPALSGPEYESDPDREQYYDAAAYADLGWVSTDHLDYARSTWQNLMSGTDTRPPPAVLRCVKGTYLPTAGNTRHAQNGQVIRGSWTNGDGDTIVTELSAVLGDWPAYAGTLSHESMPAALAGDGEMVKLILDESIPPVPPPVTQLDPPPGLTMPGLVNFLDPIGANVAHDC